MFRYLNVTCILKSNEQQDPAGLIAKSFIIISEDQMAS